ncbi:Transcriptional regulator, DeoR family [hydrothermal vent metagenome]|uniref:Transcriptional regulator, DeoR family n=1 Tax=hydrothermal vent metagenome TaxID=652676 RepID=A0A3B1AN33_9ZZZZ
MRKADRLFQIIQILRSHRLVTTARFLAEQLEVTERTIYRDIKDLILSGVPILSEAGVGYILQKGFDLPPLMFTDNELTAITLGARLVESWSDLELANAAKLAIQKIKSVVPERLQTRFEHEHLFSPFRQIKPHVAELLASCRLATDSKHKIEIEYFSLSDEKSRRCVLPLALFFWGTVWTLAAWCELRQGFRTFRIDRITKLIILNDVFNETTGRTLNDYLNNSCDN